MLKKLLIVFWFVFGFSCFTACAGEKNESALDIFFVRHAETIGNLTGDYSNNRGDKLTKQGYQETEDVVKKLEEFGYDAILVSPTNRTRLTILPYLKKNKLAGEIWPEIAECCYQKIEPMPKSCSKADGRKIRIKGGNKNFLRLRDKNTNRFYKKETYGQGLCQMEDAYNLLREKYWLSGKKILLVSHGNFGKMMIKRLLGYSPAPKFHPSNAKVTHLRQTKDGTFHLVRLNDKKVLR